MDLTIGSRGSRLALWQAEWAKAALERAGARVRIDVIRTLGDRNQDAAFAEIGGKGVFTKEVDEALLSGRTDLSVHSLKDLPTDLPGGLCLGAVSPRADVRDALVAPGASSLDDLADGATVGTSSLRRQALLCAARPGLVVKPLRGNVDTRLSRAGAGGLSAVVLASAGLDRLGLAGRISARLPPETFVPAPGQGAMGIVTRKGDAKAMAAVAALNDEAARAAVTAERAALADLGGGCRVPLGAWARTASGRLVADGAVALPDGSRVVRARCEGDPEEAEALGKALAKALADQGAREILREVLG